jgi:hypothetical protein
VRQLILTDYVEVICECFGDAAFALSTWSLLCDGRLVFRCRDPILLSRGPASTQC